MQKCFLATSVLNSTSPLRISTQRYFLGVVVNIQINADDQKTDLETPLTYISCAFTGFSFDYGPVHIVSASTEHDYSVNSAQIQWIQKDLETANANRANVPWIV